MKKKITLIVFALLAICTLNVNAQEESSWSTGVDIYSSYIWRGSKFGTGAAFQPSVKYNQSGFTLGAWGSASTGSEEAMEMDLFASYSVGGLSVTLTDYYFGGDWTEYKTMHSLEPSLSYGLGDLSLTAAYMFLPGMDADGETPSTNFGSDGDSYFEAAYSFSHAKLTLGAGDGQYTRKDTDPEGKFNICNIGIGTSKEVKLTDSFSLPVSGSVILNPTTGGFFITVGLSL
ncbi:MAG TPA: hypothetical protein VFC65_06535 [Prolixibacteraceae bacterium]|nr:hypothetical protein [Prolixibacteraceae bacterium]